MIVAVDFDGTCVANEYPRIGKDIGAAPVLRKFIEKGHKLILYTMRSGKELREAVDWFRENGIPLYGVNENPSQKSWTDSPKVFAHAYIDDAAVGCPCKFAPETSSRPHVDWSALADLPDLLTNFILHHGDVPQKS
jgi:hypothetical protein